MQRNTYIPVRPTEARPAAPRGNAPQKRENEIVNEHRATPTADKDATHDTTSSTGAGTSGTNAAPKKRAEARRGRGDADDEQEEGEERAADEESPVRGRRVMFEVAETGEAEPAFEVTGKPWPLLSNKRADKLVRQGVEPIISGILSQINEEIDDERLKWDEDDLFDHYRGIRKANRCPRAAQPFVPATRARVVPADTKGKQRAGR